MNKKFFILLFAIVFYNGVTYSSPVDGQQISDAKLSEEKLPTSDHINKKIEHTAVPSIQPPPVSQNSSAPAPSQVSTVKNETVHPAAINTTISVTQPVSIKNVTQDNSKNTTEGKNSSTPVVESKNSSQPVIENKNSSQPVIENKNSSQPVIDNENSGRPAEHVTVSGGLPTVKSITDMPKPIIPGQATTVSPTVAAPVNKTDNETTTIASPSTKPTVVTLPPTPKESVVIEHKVLAPAEEKHFDGPSFIGGIVLTIGLTAIGFIAFKYYKSGKIDMNYRTL